MNQFLNALNTLRCDDHRYYHQSRINQTLHLISAISFLIAYGLLPVDPALAAIIGWCVAMVSRQSGHIFFEPRGFDPVNQVSYDYKETIKVGYNMRRKGILIAIWVAIPVMLALSPGLFGLIAPATSIQGTLHTIGLAWLALAVAGIAFRVLQLWVLRDLLTGLAWMTKILTDPFYNVAIYYKAPLALLRGEMLDPMAHLRPH